MRKLLVFSFLLVSLSLVSVYSQQTTDTASITLQGTVEKFVSIDVTPSPGFDDLDLQSVVSNQNVATVTETSNVREGYTVTLTSTNATSLGTANPAFVGQNGGESLTYTLTYDGNAVTFVSGSVQVTDSNTTTPALGIGKDMNISYDGTSVFLQSDVYDDTLTFTVTAK